MCVFLVILDFLLNRDLVLSETSLASNFDADFTGSVSLAAVLAAFCQSSKRESSSPCSVSLFALLAVSAFSNETANVFAVSSDVSAEKSILDGSSTVRIRHFHVQFTRAWSAGPNLFRWIEGPHHTLLFVIEDSHLLDTKM